MRLQSFINQHLLQRTGISYMLYPLSLVYSKIVLYKLQRDEKRQSKAAVPVISIGNIVSGGSGKTPLTISLVRMLSEAGIKVAVSHRGYKGRYEHSLHIVRGSEGLIDSAAELGDEAYMLATQLPDTPVAVGKNRKLAVLALLKRYPETRVVVLDDALQNRKLYHDLDLVSFNLEQGLGNGWTIPAGYLREPLSSLKRNFVAVINSKAAEPDFEVLREKLKARCDRVFCARALPLGLLSPSGDPIALESVRKAALISAIASPGSFEALARQMGLNISKHFIFVDHYNYQDKNEILKITQWCREQQITRLICTQKDLRKLETHRELRALLAYIPIRLQFEDREALKQVVLGVVENGLMSPIGTEF